MSLGWSKHLVQPRFRAHRDSGFLLFFTDHCTWRPFMYFSVSCSRSSY